MRGILSVLTMRIWCLTTHLLLTSLLLIGCQSYEAAPVDLLAYEAVFNARVIDSQPVSDFARQLRASGDQVPLHFDLEDGISCAEGEVMALFYNPALRIARLEAGVALATRENAGLWDDPVFGFDGAQVISPTSLFEYGFMLGLTIPISGRLEIEKERAGAAYEAELRIVKDAEWHTRAEVRRHWAAWNAAIAQAELIAETIVDLERINEIADRLEEVGELNRVERRLLRIQLADMTVQASEIELKVVAAEVALLELLGLPPQASERLIPTFPQVTTPETSDVTARLIQANTELAIHFARYQTAEETLRLEIAKQFPDIVIGSGYGTEFNDHRVMFGVSIPVPILNANRAAIAEAHAEREVARAAAETTFSSLIRELSAANTALEIKRHQRERYEGRIIPLLAAQSHDIEQIAALGELDMFVLLETVTRTLNTKKQLIKLHVDELDATITVCEILGPDPVMATESTTTDDNVAGGIQ